MSHLVSDNIIAAAVWLALFAAVSPAECLQLPAERQPELADYQWKPVSRAARLAVARQEYDQAIALYQKALKLEARSDGRAEPALDLTLNLVECYRLAGRLQEALKILDSLEPKFLKQNFKDELLPARYWRKRSLVESDLGNHKAAADAYLQAFLIVARYFPETSAHATSARMKLHALMNKTPQTAFQIPGILRTMRSGSMSAEQQQVFNQLHTAALDAGPDVLKSCGLDQSRAYIAALTEQTQNFDDIYDLWQAWLALALKANPKDELLPVRQYLAKLIEGLHKTHTREAIVSEISARLMLGAILNFRSDAPGARLEWQQMTELLKELHEDKSCPASVIEGASRRPMMVLNAVVDYLAKNPMDDQNALTAVTLADQWSKMNMRIAPQYRQSSFNARYALVRIRLLQLKPAEAEAPLASLVPEGPIETRKLAELQFETAQLYLKQADIAKAKMHFHLAEQLKQ